MINISAVYPNSAGSRFDLDYYRDRHTPFAEGLLGSHGLIALRTVAGVEGLDGQPPAYWVISEMRFPSRDVFDRAIAACGEALFADIVNYTDITPILQVSTFADRA